MARRRTPGRDARHPDLRFSFIGGVVATRHTAREATGLVYNS